VPSSGEGEVVMVQISRGRPVQHVHPEFSGRGAVGHEGTQLQVLEVGGEDEFRVSLRSLEGEELLGDDVGVGADDQGGVGREGRGSQEGHHYDR